jgi:hypothetical protein
MNSEELIGSVLDCKNLIVILKNRYGEKYTEHYHLSNILYSSGKFWGKFRNIHQAKGHINIDESNTVAYAYNNFCNLISTCCLKDQLGRYYSAYAYASIEFKCRGNYKKIWSNIEKNNIKGVSNAVNNGLNLKLKIEDNDGYIYIVPVHTVEVYDNGQYFTLETEFDGYPENLRHFSTLNDLGKKFDNVISKGIDKGYPSIEFHKTEIFLTSFSIMRSEVVIHRRLTPDNKIVSEEMDIKSLEVWSEE